MTTHYGLGLENKNVFVITNQYGNIAGILSSLDSVKKTIQRMKNKGLVELTSNKESIISLQDTDGSIYSISPMELDYTFWDK